MRRGVEYIRTKFGKMRSKRYSEYQMGFVKTIKKQEKVSVCENELTLNNMTKSKEESSDKSDSQVFFGQIRQLSGYFHNIVVLVLVIVLTVLYWIGSTYYECGNATSHFSLTYFNSHSLFLQTCICVVLVVFNALILFGIHKLKSNDNTNTNTNNNNKNNSKKRSIIGLIYSLFWLCGYLFTILFSIAYILSSNLPNDNTLNIDTDFWASNGVKYAFVLLLSLSNAMIVPGFVRSLKDHMCCQRMIHTSTIIFILRTLQTIVIPFVVSILLLNKCGKYWTTLWKPCVVESKSWQFGEEWDTTFKESRTVSVNFTLLIPESTSDDMCNTRSNSVNLCLREFFDTWGDIILSKAVLLIFMPFVIVCLKTLVKKMWRQQTKIKTDSEYTMLASKCEIIIIFACVYPILIPICGVGILCNVYTFDFALSRLKWSLVHSPFSFDVLFYSVLCEEVVLVCFMWSLFPYSLMIFMICCFGVCDIGFIASFFLISN